MRSYALEVGQAVAGARRVYETDTRFGRQVTVGPRYFLAGALLIMVIGLVLRLWNLGGASLWTDEVLTAIRAQAPFQESLKSIMSAGNQTPIYFLSLRFFPNTTEALLRLPSALLGLLGVALLMAAVLRLYRNTEMALWAGALLAVNPFHVWLSRTARPYSLVFVLSLLIAYTFLQMARGNRSRLVWGVFAAASTVAYATHFTAVGLLGAQAMIFVFGWRTHSRWFPRWLAAQALAAVPVLTWTYLVLRDPPPVASYWIPRPELRDIPLTLWNMTLGYDGVFKWTMVPGLMIATLGIIFGLGYALGDRQRDERNFFWMWLIVGPLAFIFLLSTLIVSIYVDRYFMVMLPAVLLLMIQAWARFSPRLWRIALGVIIVTCLYSVLFSFVDGSYHRDDWRDAAAYVAGRVEDGDAIVLERDNTFEAFTRYYQQSEPYLAGEDEVEDADMILLSEIPDTNALEQTADRLWVVYRNPNEDVHRLGLMPDFDPFDPRLSAMGEWLSAYRPQVLEIQTFNGMKVLLLDPDSAPVPAGN
ncbi:MAG: glycosyltransferase family 39 protein [Chloroflexota bacterium]